MKKQSIESLMSRVVKHDNGCWECCNPEYICMLVNKKASRTKNVA